ncbi:WS/DGAT/MGAT family O-acyltransferase [Mycolicibacterium gadium]|uniref:Diacylglycerol O-acyltransferase n=1 Tax=Mycolicibacterium gadium TaxID=1794 RepID=A0ABT6GKC1_MYCGU|nr:wax ester/triacylglycerol synthase family O-acyltransferase [Mycolicibacterium gadium]MDG5481710.1 wax ester/triacylglycerol synthase family O-acyltransferase [Mycolicibacterium gadium]
MQQLSWTDDMMLRAERPETPMQIQMLLIYDPSTAPGGRVTFKGILEEVDSRLHLAPTFRRRLTELPGGLHKPYWVDDPNFDLEYHVRHIALPQPGDWRQLCIQIARIHARQIDLRRPPWEMTVIEGLNSVPGVPPGSFAVGLKLHHCAADGMESVELMAALHGLEPDGPRPDPPETPWAPDELPSTSTLVSKTAFNIASYPLRASGVVVPNALKAVRQLAGMPTKVVGGVASALASRPGPLFAPATRFNNAASPHRVFEARFHDLADFQRIKASVPGATINDVAVAYVGGTLRRYLQNHDELPEQTLVSACPASIRDSNEKGAGGNRLFGRLQSLQTDSSDPLERLAMISEQSAGFRDSSDTANTSQLMELVGLVPTTLLGLTVKAASAMPFSGPTIANTTVSNVPGPTVPVYFAGARLVRVTGMGPLIAGMNLFHVIASYNGTVSMGVTADRDALPDPAHYAECMQAAFDELLAAAG